MNVFGIIMARAGSIGLRNKHMASLLGMPVISYTFEHARASRLLTHIAVSSDCPHVLRLARVGEFEAIARPAELATSDASVQDVMIHALHEMERSAGVTADAAVVLYGNVPVRGEAVIDRAVEHLFKTGCDSVRTFCPVGKWHPAWMSRIEDDVVRPLRAGSIHRRQDLEPLYLHDGAVVAVTRASLMRGETYRDDPHAFFGVDRRGIFTEMGETVEIDHLRDLYWAEAVLRERQQQPQMKVAS